MFFFRYNMEGKGTEKSSPVSIGIVVVTSIVPVWWYEFQNLDKINTIFLPGEVRHLYIKNKYCDPYVLNLFV